MGKKRKRRRTQQGSWFSRNFKYVALAFVAVVAIAVVSVAIIGRPTTAPASEARPNAMQRDEPAAKPVAVFVGDSYTEGIGASDPANRWSTLVAKAQGWTEINQGQGFTGYTIDGPDELDRSRYSARLDAVSAAKPDIIILSGGQNDLQSDMSEVTVAARNTILALHATNPDAQLIILGPATPGEIDSQVTRLDDAVKAAAAEVGATYISQIAPNIYTTPESFGPDKMHPSDVGHKAIADRVNAAITSG